MGLSETFSSHITNIKIRHILLFLTILQIRPIIPDFYRPLFFGWVYTKLNLFCKVNRKETLTPVFRPQDFVLLCFRAAEVESHLHSLRVIRVLLFFNKIGLRVVFSVFFTFFNANDDSSAPKLHIWDYLRHFLAISQIWK